MAFSRSEWLTCDSRPAKFLRHLETRSSDRKLRFFTCALIRNFRAPQLDDPIALKALETAEAYADGQATANDLKEALSWILAGSQGRWKGYVVLEACYPKNCWGSALSTNCTCNSGKGGVRTAKKRSDLLRCIFSSAVLEDVVADPRWATWNDGSVVKLAQAAYENRELPSGLLDNSRLAILADALEETGCTSVDILSHCRSPGPHVRGCWVVDLVLGKE